MNLGMLIDALEAVEHQDAIVELPGGMCPWEFSSWRGNYYDLAIVPMDSRLRVSEFLEKCRAADGATFPGWKGGEYRMSRRTPVWVSPIGDDASWQVSGIRSIEGRCILDLAWVAR